MSAQTMIAKRDEKIKELTLIANHLLERVSELELALAKSRGGSAVTDKIASILERSATAHKSRNLFATNIVNDMTVAQKTRLEKERAPRKSVPPNDITARIWKAHEEREK